MRSEYGFKKSNTELTSMKYILIKSKSVHSI